MWLAVDNLYRHKLETDDIYLMNGTFDEGEITRLWKSR